MKPINLISFTSAINKLSPTIFEKYKRLYHVNIKETEKRDLDSLVEILLHFTQNTINFDHFYFGYSIPQIGKEFDLLRFGKKSIVNVELKKENTGEKILDQLIRNKYYLSFLGKKVHHFTYVSETQELFLLDKNEKLIEIDFNFLVSKLEEQKVITFENVDTIFNPINYLVSPFNSTDAFISNQYFLTQDQENKKKDILNLRHQNQPCYVSISGEAGTGKSLLSYDIAKNFLQESKNVLIIHCGLLNTGHKILRNTYGWDIVSVNSLENCAFKNYHLVVFDEVQRITTSQLDFSIKELNKTSAKVIFSFDPKQCLTDNEIQSNIPGYLKKNLNIKEFTLKNTIRINKVLHSFINNLFDLTKKNKNYKYTNVDIQFFSNEKDANKYLQLLMLNGWKIFNYNDNPTNETNKVEINHEVLGQEFDNVVAVIDSRFYYDKNKLTANFDSFHTYNPTNLLFQNVTRTRKKLSLVILNNEAVLEKLLDIVNQ